MLMVQRRTNQVAVVDSNSWAYMRGIFASGHIALDLMAILLHHCAAPPAQ